MENNSYEGPERREVFRVVYPLSERPWIKVRQNKFEVMDISEKGIRFFNANKRTFANWVHGTITLHDNSRLDIDGKIAWARKDEIGLHLITPIPYTTILKEQQYLIMTKSHYVGDGRKKSAPEEKKTVKVYLVQHGDAVSKEINPERPLSDKGRKDVEKIAGFLKKIKSNVKIIRHSEKLRATQTAEILHLKIKSIRDIVQKNNLAPNDPIEPLWYEIMKAHEDLLIVGHLPFLSRLASRLLSGNADQNLITFKQGGIVCLESYADKKWQIGWMIIPELLK